MTIRYRIHLSIRYEFDRPSGVGRQLLRISPPTIPGVQTVVNAHVSVSPRARELRQFIDFFGTSAFEVVVPAGLHEMTYDMQAEVIRNKPAYNAAQSTPLGMLAADIAANTSLDGHAPHHFLFASPRIPYVPDIAAFARTAAAGCTTTFEAVEAIGRALNAAMTFDATATDVDTPITESFAGRHGVCQDYSQIMIAALRTLGIPAAYVSGFLRTLPPPGQPRLQGADAMHAWVRAWTGSQTGWVEYDPTNAFFANGDHVVIGYGRDYIDAAPVTGMLRLDGDQRTGHSVDVEELF